MNEVERTPVKRLDQALRLWELDCFKLNAATRIFRGFGVKPDVPLEGPVAHYHELRRQLLSSSNDLELDQNKFIGTNKQTWEILKGLSLLPTPLFNWTKFSRRVFNLSEDIQLQLEHTSLDDIRWPDVKLPFAAYGMQLERTICIDKYGGYDFVLVSQVDNNKATHISLLPTNLERYSFPSTKDRQDINTLLNKQRWSRARDKLLEIEEPNADVSLNFPVFSIPTQDLDIPVSDSEIYLRSIERIVGHIEEWDLNKNYLENSAQLIVGFCLYLKQLPEGNRYKSEWRQVPTSPDPTVITNEAEVCYITSTHPLSRKVREGLIETSRGGHEKRWHHRRGYWSRKKGQGANPNAPKIVWHPPQEIRKDRKPLGIDSVPSGAKTQV